MHAHNNIWYYRRYNRYCTRNPLNRSEVWRGWGTDGWSPWDLCVGTCMIFECLINFVTLN